MDDMMSNKLIEYSSISLETTDATVYCGFLTIMGRRYEYCIECPHNVYNIYTDECPLAAATLSYNWLLRESLGTSINDLLLSRLHTASSVELFLIEFNAVVENELRNKLTTTVSYDGRALQIIVDQLQELGYDRVSDIDISFKWIDFIIEDQACRPHKIRVKLNDDFPNSLPECLSYMPKLFKFTNNTNFTLSTLLKEFEECLREYQTFWDVMDDVDANTWVLDPDQPSRAATYRRIAIGSNVSVHFNLHPSQPNILPQIQILGPEYATKTIQKSYSENCFKWNEGNDFLENLTCLLGIDLPTKNSTKIEDMFTECCICLETQPDVQGLPCLPDQSCSDCKQTFHTDCLYDWLTSLPHTQRSFNLLFGDCPYCDQRISMRMAKT